MRAALIPAASRSTSDRAAGVRSPSDTRSESAVVTEAIP